MHPGLPFHQFVWTTTNRIAPELFNSHLLDRLLAVNSRERACGPPSGEEAAIGHFEFDDERVLISDFRLSNVAHCPPMTPQFKKLLVTKAGVLGGHLAVSFMPLHSFAKLEGVCHWIFLRPFLAHCRNKIHLLGITNIDRTIMELSTDLGAVEPLACQWSDGLGLGEECRDDLVRAWLCRRPPEWDGQSRAKCSHRACSACRPEEGSAAILMLIASGFLSHVSVSLFLPMNLLFSAILQTTC